RIINKRIQIHRFVSNMLVCCIIAIVTTLIMRIPGIHGDMEPIIAGSIMPMLPGVALTNAFRDTLQGDYVSGTARLVEAIVIAVSLAIGIGAGLAVGKAILGGVL
ncbi:MAG: threonine/serine exporter family protein, partial [Clostridiales bacterium]|nr:threonine/serine exporter family protein [Clostridiales bacterium]